MATALLVLVLIVSPLMVVFFLLLFRGENESTEQKGDRLLLAARAGIREFSDFRKAHPEYKTPEHRATDLEESFDA